MRLGDEGEHVRSFDASSRRGALREAPMRNPSIRSDRYLTSRWVSAGCPEVAWSKSTALNHQVKPR